MARTKTTPRKISTTTTTNKIPCDKCHRQFSRIQSLKRHYQSKHNAIITQYECTECFATFGRKDIARRHLKNVHNNLDIKLDTFQTTIYTYADVPDKWTPPFESTPKKRKTIKKATTDVTTTPKFRIVPGNNIPYVPTTQPSKSLSSSSTSTISTVHEPPTNTFNLLIEDLQLSESDSGTTISSTTTEPNGWIDPRDWIIIDEC